MIFNYLIAAAEVVSEPGSRGSESVIVVFFLNLLPWLFFVLKIAIVVWIVRTTVNTIKDNKRTRMELRRVLDEVRSLREEVNNTASSKIHDDNKTFPEKGDTNERYN